MINDPAVRAIVDAGPRKFLTRGQKVREWLLWVLCAAVLILGAGYFANKEATSNVADCTNTNLGLRNAPSAADSQAHITWAQANAKWVTAINTVLTDPPNSAESAKDFATFLALSATFQSATNAYVATLQTDQAQRAATPLGKC